MSSIPSRVINSKEKEADFTSASFFTPKLGGDPPGFPVLLQLQLEDLSGVAGKNNIAVLG